MLVCSKTLLSELSAAIDEIGDNPDHDEQLLKVLTSSHQSLEAVSEHFHLSDLPTSVQGCKHLITSLPHLSTHDFEGLKAVAENVSQALTAIDG